MRFCGGASDVAEESERWGVEGAIVGGDGMAADSNYGLNGCAVKNDVVRSRDRNVRSEATNSLSMFGSEAIADLVAAFGRDDNWLVCRSIMAPLCDRRSAKIDYQNAILKIRK
ncbi:HEAT repeat domain-containing protein [Microcoleus vaginatus]|uniref:HEAT repeat domain-containing protein n=1 Tax=Microcoleus vaginatus TaxID=119532 RepID=UPI001F6011C8